MKRKLKPWLLTSPEGKLIKFPQDPFRFVKAAHKLLLENNGEMGSQEFISLVHAMTEAIKATMVELEGGK